MSTVVVVTLVILLCTRELAADADGRGSIRLAQSLNICTVPPIMLFTTVLTMKALATLPVITISVKQGLFLSTGTTPAFLLASDKSP
ncbi:hypothetical protein ACFLTL_02920 [Chloroflexota bacterium]